MDIQEINTRLSEINSEMYAEGADIEALTNEADTLIERKRVIANEEAARVELRNKIATGSVEVKTVTEIQEERKMDVKELRNSPAYIDAYAEMIKRIGRGQPDADVEVRKLLTENATNGTIAVPDFVYEVIGTAWEEDKIMGRVPSITDIPGNLKVNFEISSTDATKHTEGGDAVDEEQLVEGIVTIAPDYFKKWIAISDKVMTMRGEAFLRYIYAEITHRIIRGSAAELIKLISTLPDTATSTEPSVQTIAEEPTVDTVSNAASYLSGEASTPVILMNRRTSAQLRAAAKAANYNVDPFDGLEVIYTSDLPAYADADEEDVYMIVGDLNGARKLMPEGDNVTFIFDELSRKKEDLVEVLGKQLIGVGVIACDRFTTVTKPAEEDPDDGDGEGV